MDRDLHLVEIVRRATGVASDRLKSRLKVGHGAIFFHDSQENMVSLKQRITQSILNHLDGCLVAPISINKLPMETD